MSVLERDRWQGSYRLPTRTILRDFVFSRANAVSCGVPADRLIDGVDPAFGLSIEDDGAVARTLEERSAALRAKQADAYAVIRSLLEESG